MNGGVNSSKIYCFVHIIAPTTKPGVSTEVVDRYPLFRFLPALEERPQLFHHCRRCSRPARSRGAGAPVVVRMMDAARGLAAGRGSGRGSALWLGVDAKPIDDVYCLEVCSFSMPDNTSPGRLGRFYLPAAVCKSIPSYICVRLGGFDTTTLPPLLFFELHIGHF